MKRDNILTAGQRIDMFRAGRVTCPRCKAEPGEPCRSIARYRIMKSGPRGVRPHKERLDIVRNAGMEWI